MSILLIGVFGVTGVYSRYFVEEFIKKFGIQFPLGTLTVNILGCLLAGFLFFFVKQKNDSIYLMPLVIGFCGGLTTFSSFTLQAFEMLEAQQLSKALTYLVISPVLGLICLFLGYKLGIYFLAEKL